MGQQELWSRIKDGLSETIVGMDDPDFLLELAPKQLEILVVCLGDLMVERENVQTATHF